MSEPRGVLLAHCQGRGQGLSIGCESYALDELRLQDHLEFVIEIVSFLGCLSAHEIFLEHTFVIFYALEAECLGKFPHGFLDTVRAPVEINLIDVCNLRGRLLDHSLVDDIRPLLLLAVAGGAS